MKWLRVLVLACLAVIALCVVALVLLLGPLRERMVERLRPRLEALAGEALAVPVSAGALRLSLRPLGAEADVIAVGVAGAVARVDHVAATVDLRASLRAGRPVVAVRVEGVWLDVPAWAARPHEPALEPAEALPRFRLDPVAVRTVRVQLTDGDAPLAADVDAIDAAVATDVDGRLGLTAIARSLALTRDTETLPIARAQVALQERVTGMHVTALAVQGDGIDLSGEAGAGGDTLSLRGALDLTRLAWVSESLARVEGEAELTAQVRGPLEEPLVTATIRVPALRMEERALGELATAVEASLERVTMRSLRLGGPAGELEASAAVTLDTPRTYSATLQWSRLDVRRLAGLAEGLPKPFSADGRAELTGTLEPLTARGSAEGMLVPAGDVTPVAWHAQANYGAQGGTGELAVGQGPANRAEARLSIDPAGALDGAVELSIGEPAVLGALLPVTDMPNLRGALHASARIAGTTAAPEAAGELNGHDLMLAGVAVDHLAATFSADRAALRLHDLRGDLQPGMLTAAGTIALDDATANDFQAQASHVAGDTLVLLTYALTGTVLPIGRGTLAAEARLRGPWAQLQLEAHAAMDQFWLTQEWIQRASVDATARWPRWTATAELRNRAGQTATLRATGHALDDLALEAEAPAWQLTALHRGESGETGGAVQLQADLRGPAQALSGHATARAIDLVLGGRRVGAIDVAIEATHGRFDLRATALDDTVRVRATLAPQPGWPVTATVEWHDARLGHLLQPGSDVWILSSGRADASTRLTALADAEVNVALQSLQLANEPYQLALATPVQLACRRGTCTLDALELRGTDTTVRVRARLTFAGDVSVVLTGNGNLRLLELAGPIESARGRFTVDARVERRGGAWDVDGQIALDDVGLDAGAPIAITRTVGRFTFDGSALRIDRLEGRAGTGTFAVGGRIDLQHGPDVTWTLTDVGADLMPSLEAELAGQGAVSGPWEAIVVSGEIRILRMLYDRDLEIRDLLPSFNRALAAAPRRPAEHPITLDLHIVAPGELYVENNLARIEAAADLRITGTADRPALAGRVEALDGDVTFRDRVFELMGATVDFRPDLGLTAALNITAESTIDTPDATYTIGIRVTGTTADPRVTLSSDDPALSQTDIATLITMGRTTAQLREGGGGFSMYDALALVPRQLAAPVTQEAQRLLPVDRISFEPTFSRTTGTFEPQLKLGKDLTDSLAVSVGQTFGVESRTTAQADYRLSPHVFIPLSWESQTQTQEGAYAAGVKLRYDFWRLTPYTLLRTLR